MPLATSLTLCGQQKQPFVTVDTDFGCALLFPPGRISIQQTRFSSHFFSTVLRASVAFGNGLLLFCRSRDRRVGRVLHLMLFFFVCRSTTRRQVVLAIGVRRSERVHANHESRPCERCMSFLVKASGTCVEFAAGATVAPRNNTRFAEHVTPTHSTTYRAGVLVEESVEIAVRNVCVAQTLAMLHAGFSFTVQRCPHPGGHHLWSGFDCHGAAAWHPQRFLAFRWRDPGTHALHSRCAAAACSSNLKLYTDRMQERSVPQSKQVENRLARVCGQRMLGTGPAKKTRTERLNPRRLHCFRLHANISGWACSIVVHQLHAVLAVADSLRTCRYSLLLDPPRFMLLKSRPAGSCASHSGQLVQRIWCIPGNLAHCIRVTLTPSLETRITTSRLLCCVLCCRICSDVSRWWQMSNVCRKSGTLTRRNILKEDKSEDLSLDVACTRSILLA